MPLQGSNLGTPRERLPAQQGGWSASELAQAPILSDVGSLTCVISLLADIRLIAAGRSQS